MIDDSINYEYIIRYLRDLLPKRDGLMGELEEFAKKYDVPISQPETMKLLEVLIRLGRVESVLEIGCAIGYSLDGSYDMVFLDAAKAQYGNFFPHCLRLLKPGGLLVSDNVLYKGMTATDELVQHRKITIVKRLRQYLSDLSSNPELETSVLPVGDGVALSILRRNDHV